jgi:hypothetical protein
LERLVAPVHYYVVVVIGVYRFVHFFLYCAYFLSVDYYTDYFGQQVRHYARYLSFGARGCLADDSMVLVENVALEPYYQS